MTDSLISDARAFLNGLAANNSRDWFMAHKADYEGKLRQPALALLDALVPRLAEMTGYAVDPKLFRINRDVRFSKDKTPYKTHLHMLWWVRSGTRAEPALFLGIERDRTIVGTGMPEFPKEVLADWRKMLDLDGDRIAGILTDVTARGYGEGGWSPALKRVPPPYPQDHPHGALLKLKGLTVSGPLKPGGRLEDRVAAAFAELWPVSDMLVGVAETPVI